VIHGWLFLVAIEMKSLDPRNRRGLWGVVVEISQQQQQATHFSLEADEESSRARRRGPAPFGSALQALLGQPVDGNGLRPIADLAPSIVEIGPQVVSLSLYDTNGGWVAGISDECFVDALFEKESWSRLQSALAKLEPSVPYEVTEARGRPNVRGPTSVPFDVDELQARLHNASLDLQSVTEGEHGVEVLGALAEPGWGTFGPRLVRHSFRLRFSGGHDAKAENSGSAAVLVIDKIAYDGARHRISIDGPMGGRLVILTDQPEAELEVADSPTAVRRWRRWWKLRSPDTNAQV